MGQSELKAELGGGGVTPGKMPPCIFDRSLFYFFLNFTFQFIHFAAIVLFYYVHGKNDDPIKYVHNSDLLLCYPVLCT